MKLSIIIVSYNTQSFLDQALASVFKHVVRKIGENQVEVIVVDNASTDSSIEMVQSNYPKVRVIRNDTNLGFATANNKGMRIAAGEYVMLLNSDAEITNAGKMTELLEYMDTHEKTAVLTPKIILPSGKLDWACHRGFPSPWNAFSYFSGLERLFPTLRLVGGYHQTWKNLKNIHKVDACSGAAMIVRVSAIRQVGLLDEQFFMYAEDIDWCYRFHQAGWSVVYHPGLTVLHHKSVSGKNNKNDTEHAKKTRAHSHTMFYDTMTQFYEKHYEKTYPKFVTGLVKFGIRCIKYMKGASNGTNNDKS